MKTSSHPAIGRPKTTVLGILLASGFLNLLPVGAADPGTNSVTATEATGKDLPLPLHQFEGKGGFFATGSARLVNPPRDGEPVGRPSIGFAFISLGYGRSLEAFTLTETPWNRLELGYGWDHLELGDLPTAVLEETGLRLEENAANLHNCSARLKLLEEGEFDQRWLPRLTFGATYKYNSSFNSINQDLHGALNTIGLTDNQGVDLTLYAGKAFRNLPIPVAVNVGGRLTRGANFGLLGFADHYTAVFEANLLVSLSPHWLLGVEFHQSPDLYTPLGDLLQAEDNIWTISVSYLVNRHCTLALGYGHLGDVLNHTANSSWGIATKWEF